MPCVVFGTYMASPFDFAWVLLKSGYRSEGITPEEIREMEYARLDQMQGQGGATGPMHSYFQEQAQGPELGEEQFDLQRNNPGVRPSQTDFRRGDNLMVAREKRGLQSMKDEPKLQRRIDRRQQLGRN